MKKRNIISLVLLLLTELLLAVNSNHKISVNTFNAIDQFPSNSVQRILQDRDGYLWFGTLDGLCRYDAYRVIVFRSDTKNPNLLTNNEITCIAEDMNNNIWIGTKSGINILDKDTYKITQLNNDNFDNTHIKSIIVSSDSMVWIGANNRLFKYDHRTEKIENLSTEESGLPITGINSIYEDKFGDIWIAYWRAGLHKIKKNGDIIHYPKVGDTNNPFSIYQDNQYQYWIGTWGDGLYQFYPQQNEASMYVQQKVLNRDGSQIENTFYSIIQDDCNGYIWLMTFSGISALEHTPQNEIVQLDMSHLFKGTNNIFSELIKDNNGDIWVAAFSEGAFTINFNKTEISNIPLKQINRQLGITPNITDIHQDDSGVLWLNQNRYGLCFYDLKTDNLYTYKDIESLKNIEGIKYVAAITGIKKSEDVWLGLYNEPVIYIVNRNGKQVTIKEKLDLSIKHPYAGSIRQIFEDSKNNIWIVTTIDTFVKPQNSDEIIIVDTQLQAITSITEDVSGNIWLGTEYSGVYKIEFQYNLDSDTKYIVNNYSKENKQLLSNHITTICAGSEATVWFGTSEGAVFVYNQVSKRIEDHTELIRIANEAIQNIIEDRYNNIWITTNKRIVEYNPKNGASRDYSSSDGLLISSLLKNSYYYNKMNNILYLGGNKGISLFSASQKTASPNKAKNVIISDVKISGNSVFSSTIDSDSKNINTNLNIEATDKNIEIDFSSLDYRYPGKILYAYKMEGIDDDWVYTDRQFATYNQLKKGLNTFRVKATDENKLWTSDITTYEIYKKPAFYETWWAYLSYFFLSLAFAYLSFRTAKNRISLRNKLKIARIEKEKSEELTQTKLMYFTNISHDFLTPLTIISCLIDDVEASLRNKAPQFETMRINVNRLKRLLQQVLDFRKVESGKMKLDIVKGEIASFVEDICYNNFTPLAQKKNIELTLESTPTQIEAYFDADKIDKALYNIISNAFKFTPNGGSIKISLSTIIKFDLPHLLIKVKDTGIGIPTEEINNVFDRFYTNKNNKVDNTNGIGLSISHDLIKLHHGSISIESELQKGSTFTIEIPIAKAAYSAQELSNDILEILNSEDASIVATALTNEASTNFTNEANHSPDTDINLLLVEDNEDILYTIKNILQKQYNVFTATNGSIALNIVKDNDIDIIISDVMMPEMNGLELCRTIKGNIETSHISMLLLTAKNRVEDRVECYEAGADGYISKPFDMKVLEARISNFLTKKKEKQKEFKADREIKIETLEYPSLDQQFLNDAVGIIEKNLSDSELNIDSFATLLNLSKSSLYRKLKTMTGLSPNEFIRNIRLKHACQMLKDPSITISEVAYSVGFTDPRYFSTCFRGEFEMTPSEYQKAQSE